MVCITAAVNSKQDIASWHILNQTQVNNNACTARNLMYKTV